MNKELLKVGVTAFFITLGVGCLVRDVLSAATGKCTCHSQHNPHSVINKARRGKVEEIEC